MIDWLVVLTPLLVLPIFLLFRFVGCDVLFNLDHLPTYEELIDEQSLKAFWPLTEEGNAPQAADTTGSFPGLYGEPPPSSGGGSSQGASGKLLRGQPAIILTRPSIDFQGGYVVVPINPALNTQSFTVEAWVVPGMWEPQRSHTVVSWTEIGSFNQLHGFSLFAGYHPVDQKVSWSASLSTGATVVLIKGAPVKIPATRTYLALTYSHVANAATLYVSQGAGAGWDTPLETVPITNGYVPVQGNSLYIGASESSPQPPPPPPPTPAPPVSVPFLGRIQAVAFYDNALSEPTLAKHRGS